MTSLVPMLLLTLAAFQFFLVFATARPFWKRHHKHHHGLTNAFKILAVDRFAVALRDVNQDPMLKCLTATRVDLDPDVPSATFQWSFNAGKRNATLHFTKGPSIDTANVVVDSDTAHPDVARYLYADPAVTCAIMELRYFGYQCTLWVRNTTKNAVSEKCFKKHAELCANGVSLYDKNTCGDFST